MKEKIDRLTREKRFIAHLVSLPSWLFLLYLLAFFVMSERTKALYPMDPFPDPIILAFLLLTSIGGVGYLVVALFFVVVACVAPASRTSRAVFVFYALILLGYLGYVGWLYLTGKEYSGGSFQF
jgi:hypothetical protein